METYTLQQCADLFRACIEIPDAQTRWNTDEDRQYARAMRIASKLQNCESWRGVEVSPIAIFKILPTIGEITNATK